jgi:peptide/nickel transport system substrate-binding protein
MHGAETTSRSLGRQGWFTPGARRLAAIAVVAITALAAAALAGTARGTGNSSHKVGDTLTIATPASPPSLDPATGANENSDYYNLAYDPLIVRAPDGTFKPGLALSWKYGPRNKTFSIKLRPGVKFSDGTKMNAKAVKVWINHAMTLPGGRATTYLNALKSIDLTGPLSLRLNFNTPTPLLELTFSQTLEMGMIGSQKGIAAKTLATQTSGAGPYMLDTADTVTGDHYTFVPNPYYWNKPAVHWKKVVVKVISNPTAVLQALKTGQVQVAPAQPVTSLDAAKSAGLKYVAPLTLYLSLSLLDRDGKMSAPLGDVRVRRALNYAIDRNAIAKVVGAGYGQAMGEMAVPGDDSYDPALEKTYPYDPTKAKQLLAAAGYPDGFTFSAVSIAAVGQDTLAQALAGELQKVGVTLKPDIKTNVGDYIGGLAGAKYPAATLSFGRLPSAINYQLLYGPNASLFNSFKSTNPQLSKLYYKLIAAPTAKVPGIARQMQAILVQQAWFVPVVATPLVVLYRSDVTGVNASVNRSVEYTTEIEPAS